MDVCKCGGKPIVNKHFKLCDSCNYKRLHDGKSREEVAKEKAKASREARRRDIPRVQANGQDGADTIKELKARFSIKKISNKRAKIEEELRRVYREIDLEREPVCEGCGRGDRALSHSHVISRALRPDLITDKENIRLHCFVEHGSCHQKWENFVPSEVVEMLDFERNLKYVADKAPDIYKKILMWLSEN